jgi:hypothetical protein
MPDWLFELAAECWQEKESDRPTFKAIMERLRTDHRYILHGANQEEVLRYEEKVYRDVREPVGRDVKVIDLTVDEWGRLLERLDRFLATDPRDSPVWRRK